jgi:uncharacterized peroxidase-related enzyme
MSRFTPLRLDEVCNELCNVLGRTDAGVEELPEFLRVLAKSPMALKAYVEADATLAAGGLSPQDRNRIALAVAEINGSGYVSTVQALTTGSAGLAERDVDLARSATAADPRAGGLLRFVQTLVLQRGEIADADFQALRQAGFAEGEIVEIVANVALNVFTNYLNLVAGTEPEVMVAPKACNLRAVADRNGSSRRVGG